MELDTESVLLKIATTAMNKLYHVQVNQNKPNFIEGQKNLLYYLNLIESTKK